MERYFLTYDMSVKLKEKGLNIPFYFFYRTDDVDKQIHHYIHLFDNFYLYTFVVVINMYNFY